jgi:hypothetical protein
VQPQRLFQLLLGGILGRLDDAVGIRGRLGLSFGLGFRFRGCRFREPCDRLVGERAPALQVAARSARARDGQEPAAALGQQLLDLPGVDVVVLLEVEHRISIGDG